MGNSQSSESILLESLHRLRQGDERARAEIITYAQVRFRTLASRMLKQFPGVKRWEETDDVLQTSLVKLHNALLSTPPNDRQHFLRLSTLQIRRTLVDLARHYRSDGVLGAIHHANGDTTDSTQLLDGDRYIDTNEPTTLEDWTAFHEAVAKLPPQEREAFELLWYQGLTQTEAATILEVTERTVRRYWTSARLQLSKMLQD